MFTFLIDTNVVIASEPTIGSDIEAKSASALQFIQLTQKNGCKVFIHPLTKKELLGDKEDGRREVRKVQVERYVELSSPVEPTQVSLNVFDQIEEGSHDWNDLCLLQNIVNDAANYLVTEDKGIHKKSKKLLIADRVLYTSDAINLLTRFFDTIPLPPPLVRAVEAHYLSPDDKIFESFREDYNLFDEWLEKCRIAHRQCWIIEYDRLAAFAIVKPEDRVNDGELIGKTLKICSFKVADEYRGLSFGELLLKTIFDFAAQNEYEYLYVTMFEKQANLIELFTDFGFFEMQTKSKLGELVVAKKLIPDAIDFERYTPLEFNRVFGPNRFVTKSASFYIIPIQEQFSSVLFPEASEQAEIEQMNFVSGNRIRKAYLCHALIKKLMPGDLLLFYRSQKDNGVIALGIIEKICNSNDPDYIAMMVGKRTVYSYVQIQEMCDKEVLVILFRQIQTFLPRIDLNELIKAGYLKSVPQSIQSLPLEVESWLQLKLRESLCSQ